MFNRFKRSGITTTIVALGMAMSMMFGYSYGLEVGKDNPATYICSCACQEQNKVDVEDTTDPVIAT